MGAGTKSKRKAGSLNKRVQTILTTEQYELLVQIAKKEKKSVSAVVREAIEAGCLEEESRRQRRHALEDLLSLEAPVADWEEMESEIAKGAMNG